ncbi:MAG TPA: hypothetical protein VGO25_11780 [Rhodanobacteraceae bacterium]|jgi:hypothetical protein|nr:hypothetical protein [Rhodanobacteraceae bacterium]
MSTEQSRTATALIKAVVLLQLKVLLGAVRDLAVGPLALVAALFDLIFLGRQEPRFFRSVLRFGEHSDRWIDVWSAGRDAEDPRRENVDTLIARVEDVVRDPQMGARHARVLKRWAERQVARAKQRAAAQISTKLATSSKRMPPSADDQK